MVIYHFSDNSLYESSRYIPEYISKLMFEKKYVVCLETAADVHGLYSGLFTSDVKAYSLDDCKINNISYEMHNGYLRTTPKQTVTDILNYEGSDSQARLETLANAFCFWGDNYIPCGLTIYGQEQYNYLKPLAINYFGGDD